MPQIVEAPDLPCDLNTALLIIIAIKSKTWHIANNWLNVKAWFMDQIIRGKVHAGRVVLPAELRNQLGIKDGEEVLFSRTGHGIEIRTLDEAIRQAQETVRQYVPEGVSLVDELLEDRRRDADLE